MTVYVYALHGEKIDVKSASWSKLVCSTDSAGFCTVTIPDKTFGLDIFVVMYNHSVTIGKHTFYEYHICYVRKIFNRYLTEPMTILVNCSGFAGGPITVHYVEAGKTYWFVTDKPLLVGSLHPRPLLELHNYYPLSWTYSNSSYTVAAPEFDSGTVCTDLSASAETFRKTALLASASARRGGTATRISVSGLGDYIAVTVSEPVLVKFVYKPALLPVEPKLLAIIIGAVLGLIVSLVIVLKVMRRRRCAEAMSIDFA